ncbi:MAG TPA: alpha amylase C-terminal domain-containing protein, partial [Actinomycetota bacterium]|nr:alpha amylase C-terminal domain-containing protein [Actinomycetota bacterium]
RGKGDWIPNRLGGRENLEAIEFFRELNTLLHGRVPGIMVIAEDSTAWPGVTLPVDAGGLGFGYKWSLGWMHDTLRYFGREPSHRQHHHEDLTFGLLYQWSENFILPLSHDEVVHEKGSLLSRMPGDDDERFAGLRALFAWMWAHPGKPLLFMGGEIAQYREWSHDRELDWHLLSEGPRHKGVQMLIKKLNGIAREHPSLWEQDKSADGFEWIEAADRVNGIYAFLRKSSGPPLACVANLSAIRREGYRVGLPTEGEWVCILDSQDERFGGASSRSGGPIIAEPVPTSTMPCSAPIDLAPLSVLWLIQKPGEALTAVP